MGKRYNLRAHAVTVSEGVANAFIAPDGSHIYPVALVEGSSATLELRGVPTNVTGFEASFPGAAAGSWAKVGCCNCPTRAARRERNQAHSARDSARDQVWRREDCF